MKWIVAVIALMCTSMMLHAADTVPATMPASMPPGEPQSKERLDKSPRHQEFVDIKVEGMSVPMNTFVVYPERKDKAPVVIVIMEIYGLSDWLRATCDQLAADGFIAIAPDFISGKGPNGGGTESITNRSDVTRFVSGLKMPDVVIAINAARDYGLKLPSANGKFATVGFCWGGAQSFNYATTQPELSAAVVFYGAPPADDLLAKIKCPVAGFYGGTDNRISGTVPATSATMKKLGKSYDPHVYEGAGHGFMRAQGLDRPADLRGAQQAWPIVVKFLTDNTKAEMK